jgi:hypothetical protein
MYSNLFQDDSGNRFIFDEESTSEMPEALKQRQADCITAGGVFFPVSNQCCKAEYLQSGWRPGEPCHDPVEMEAWKNEGKNNRTMTYVGVGVGVLAVGAGLWWWLR